MAASLWMWAAFFANAAVLLLSLVQNVRLEQRIAELTPATGAAGRLRALRKPPSFPQLLRSLGTPHTSAQTVAARSDSSRVTLAERLARLETITKGALNWHRDPFVGVTLASRCKKERAVDEHYVCMDNFPAAATQRCVVYDFGIRAQPAFGLELATEFPHCEVHAFDPSPVSIAWWASSATDATVRQLHALKNYFFHPYGAGGVDGAVELHDYNWGQVSTVRMPFFVSSDCGYPDGTDLEAPDASRKKAAAGSLPYHSEVCRANVDIEVATTNAAKGKTPAPGGAGVDQTFAKQMTRQVHMLPVKTLRTIMHELGHAHVDLLKLDVEGSEYAFLESAIDDFDCPPLAQFSVEWHHHVFDSRYGGGSSPQVNAIATYLHDRCGVKLWQRDYDHGGFTDRHRWAQDAGLSLRYQTSSFITVK